FLTTNQTLWKTPNTNFNPFYDPSVALFMEFHVVNNNDYGMILYVQQKPGESLSDESPAGPDTSCGVGPAFICLSNTFHQVGGNGIMGYMDLNFTGASVGNQVGSGAQCRAVYPGAGGSGCSFTVMYDCLVNGCTRDLGVLGGKPEATRLPIVRPHLLRRIMARIGTDRFPVLFLHEHRQCVWGTTD